MLYILTSVWVPHTPNPGQNMLLSCFSIKKCKKGLKRRKNVFLGVHPNAGRRFSVVRTFQWIYSTVETLLLQLCCFIFATQFFCVDAWLEPDLSKTIFALYKCQCHTEFGIQVAQWFISQHLEQCFISLTCLLFGPAVNFMHITWHLLDDILC